MWGDFTVGREVLAVEKAKGVKIPGGGGGEITVCNGSGVRTLDHSDMWVGEEGMSSSVA